MGKKAREKVREREGERRESASEKETGRKQQRKGEIAHAQEREQDKGGKTQ